MANQYETGHSQGSREFRKRMKPLYVFGEQEWEKVLGERALVPQETAFDQGVVFSSPSVTGESKEHNIGAIKAQVKQTLNALTPRESKVLQLRFGLTDGKGRSQRQAAEELTVSRSTVARDEANAFKKLRHPSRLIE